MPTNSKQAITSKMATSERRFDQRSPTPKLIQPNGHHAHVENEGNSDVEGLKESLKNGLVDARKKITFLRKELKEKNESLEQERQMRENAEKELVENLSINGVVRGNITPSPTMIRSQLASPVHGTRSSTPRIHMGNMETMLEELKSARLLNRTLTEKLSQAEKELDQVLISKEEMEMELEAGMTAKGAALVDKLYTAQKVREESMMVRMKMMNEEKEELLRRIKKLESEYGCDSGVETSPYDEFQLNPEHLSSNEVIGKISSANHSQAIDYHGDVIAERLNQVQNSNKRKSTEEYQKIKRERDEALTQVEVLKEELRDLQQEREVYATQHRKNEKNRLKAIQNQLKLVMTERDKALERSRDLEEEIEKIQLQFNLKNSLSHEESLRKQFNATIDTFETKLGEKENELAIAQKSYDEVVAKLNNAIRENQSMSSQLDDTSSKMKEEKRRADRSERLVTVLRRRKTISISDTID